MTTTESKSRPYEPITAPKAEFRPQLIHILQTSTLEEADVLMSAESLIKRGLRGFNLRPWELQEGRVEPISFGLKQSANWKATTGRPFSPGYGGVNSFE